MTPNETMQNLRRRGIARNTIWTWQMTAWLVTLLIIMGFGLIMLFSASYTTGYLRMEDSYHYIKSQLKCVALGLISMTIISFVDYHFWRRFVMPAYVCGLLLLVAVLFSKPINGCRRWLVVAGTTIQVSEIVKLVMILLTASLMCLIDKKRRLRQKLGQKKNFIARLWEEFFMPLIPLGPVLVLLLLEPHMSGSLLMCAIVGTMLLSNFNGGIIACAMAVGLFRALGWLLSQVEYIPYLQDRLDGWTQDIDQMTEQTRQSLYAIGSGGLSGVGLGNSVEKQLWLPECTNDFIFSVVCEELGFIGASLVIVLFVAFLIQSLYIAFDAADLFGTLVGIGITAQIGWQVFCNIGVVTNSLPNTGISLPFFSSGGSSLLFLLVEMGIMLSIARGGALVHQLEQEQRRAEIRARTAAPAGIVRR